MITNILSGLNDKQIEAVKATQGPVLVISGPGSGKTRCLTHRVAYLIASGIHPAHILGITFTNKSAEEMKNRVSSMLEGKLENIPLMGTFHSICLRILRKEIPRLGYAPNFSILDSDDQAGLVKRIMSDLQIDPKRYNPNMMLSKISKLKTDLISPESYSPSEYFPKIVAQVYQHYQNELKKMNGLDFDDLIGQTVKIFKQFPEVLNHYQDRWQYLLIDEYQDTSFDQYTFIKLLSQKYKNIFCIGDDAQSIYQFRKADIRNILNFQKDYPEAKIILLEQNYRSTQNILAAAQNVIENNKNQIRKTLWTQNQEGEKIFIKETLNERTEAIFVISKMQEYMSQGYSIHDCTILYRTHAQSRSIEEALINQGFPYQIVGGIKFYERKEIKDILAYLKFITNPKDKVSLSRLYNIPPRGIGKMTFEKILATKGKNLLEALRILSQDSKKEVALKKFLVLLEEITEVGNTKNLTSQIKYILEAIKYEEYLKTLKTSKGEAYDNIEERMENIKELLTVARKYNHYAPQGGREKFLEEIALLQDADKLKEGVKKVTLMTAHSSKGLEFPIVFLIGMEEGLFPHSRSIYEPKELEEERRLCYVAITRAKEHLVLTHTKYRNIFGVTEVNLPSRFLGELPENSVAHELFDPSQDYEEILYY